MESTLETLANLCRQNSPDSEEDIYGMIWFILEAQVDDDYFFLDLNYPNLSESLKKLEKGDIVKTVTKLLIEYIEENKNRKSIKRFYTLLGLTYDVEILKYLKTLVERELSNNPLDIDSLKCLDRAVSYFEIPSHIVSLWNGLEIDNENDLVRKLEIFIEKST